MPDLDRPNSCSTATADPNESNVSTGDAVMLYADFTIYIKVHGIFIAFIFSLDRVSCALRPHQDLWNPHFLPDESGLHSRSLVVSKSLAYSYCLRPLVSFHKKIFPLISFRITPSKNKSPRPQRGSIRGPIRVSDVPLLLLAGSFVSAFKFS